jgi:hypothetical protein
MIRNALATHVLDVGQEKKEVFLNLSFWGSNEKNVDPVIETIKTLSEWKEKLIAVTCNHHFVLNSTEQTECQLGCTHHNLNDKEALLAENKHINAEFKITFEDVKETYSRFLSTQIDLATSNLRNLCPEIKHDDPKYDEFRRWYFVFQDEMDHIKYDMQKGLQRLKKDQPYRKKYEVRFNYKSDIPNLYTDDIFQAEAVYKYYQGCKIKCWLGELGPEKKDSTNINYYPLEMDIDRRLKCCECGDRLKPGDKTVIADITEWDDYNRKETHIFNHGEVMHAKCQKKILDKDKQFHRTVKIVVSDEEVRHFSHGNASSWDLDQMMKDRFRDFRFMEITEVWPHATRFGTSYNVYGVRLKGLGRHFDDLKAYLKPSNKKETK